MLYQRHSIYAVIHILLGFIAAWIPSVGVFTILYQLLQFFFNVRVFPIERTIKPGNSIQHTSLKLAEVMLGYIIGSAIIYTSKHQ
jgi:hypothetical protein